MNFRITGRITRLLLMLFLPQPVFLWWLCIGSRDVSPLLLSVLITAGMVLLSLCFLIRLHLFPVRSQDSCPVRITVLDGGQYLISFSIWGFFLQSILYFLMLTGHLHILAEF